MKNKRNKLKIGLFGVGRFGTFHLENWLDIPEVELVGFCDTDSKIQKNIQKKYKLKYYTQKELIEAVDIVDIVVPTVSHYEIAKDALKNGKHVFIEKTITQTLKQIEELNEIAEKNGLQIGVGHIERVNPIFVKTTEKYKLNPNFIEITRLGKFNPLRGTDVSVVMELMVHDLDLLLYSVDSKIVNISAVGTKVLSDKHDIVNARIEFENGTVANITASRISAKQERKMRVFQKNLYISIDLLKNEANVYSLLKDGTNKKNSNSKILSFIPKNFPKNINYEKIQPKKYNALRKELSTFANCIMNNKQTPMNGIDGYKALELATKIIESMKKIK